MGREGSTLGRLVVESITAEDFLSYHEAQTLTLGGGGTMGLVGKNGGGKSTIASKALTWALYGTCTAQRMGSDTRALAGKAIVRRRLYGAQLSTPEASKATVRVVLSRGTTKYEIIRERSKSGKDTVVLYENGIETGSDQSVIDGLIGVDYDVFTRTVVRGQGDPWNFAEATDAKKREILDALSGSSRVETSYDKAVAERKVAADDVITFRARADDAERRAGMEDISGLERQAREWMQLHAKRVGDVKDELYQAQQRLIAAKEDDQQLIAKQAERATLEANKPMLDLKPYREACSQAGGELARAHAILNQRMKAVAEAQQLVAAGRCPMCGEPTNTHALHAKADGDTKAEHDAYTAAAAHDQQCRSALQAAEAWIANEERVWQSKLDALPKIMTAKTFVVEAEINQINRRLREMDAAQNPHLNTLLQAKLTKSDLEREAAVFREGELTATQDAAFARAWEEILHPKGFRAHLAESTLAGIENEANKWLSIISNKLQVRFPATKTTSKGVVREDIQTIVLVNGIEIDLLNLSGGELHRVNFASDLGVAAAATNGLGLALSLLVVDEQLVSGLDSEGKTALLRAINEAGIADIVVVDHDPMLIGSLPRTVQAYLGPDDYSRLQEWVPT